MSSSELTKNEGHSNASIKAQLQRHIEMLELIALANPSTQDCNQHLIKEITGGLILIGRATNIGVQIHELGERIKNRSVRQEELMDNMMRVDAKLKKIRDSIQHRTAEDSLDHAALLREDQDLCVALSEELNCYIEEYEALEKEKEEDSELPETLRKDLIDINVGLKSTISALDLPTSSKAVEDSNGALIANTANKNVSQGTLFPPHLDVHWLTST